MNSLAITLMRRLGVGTSWGGVLRITAWVVVWVLAISWVIDPTTPSPADRDIQADVPPSEVRYLGPVSTGDLAGFVAATLLRPDAPGSRSTVLPETEGTVAAAIDLTGARRTTGR